MRSLRREQRARGKATSANGKKILEGAAWREPVKLRLETAPGNAAGERGEERKRRSANSKRGWGQKGERA